MIPVFFLARRREGKKGKREKKKEEEWKPTGPCDDVRGIVSRALLLILIILLILSKINAL